MPNHSRHVGQGVFHDLSNPKAPHLIPLIALKFLPPNTNPPIPWQRVLGSSGAISSRGPGTDGAQRQQEALEAEGVEVSEGRTGELRVDLRSYGWFPSVGEVRALQEAASTAGQADDIPEEGDA
jgi:methylated-DNA-protein-cysteine methyltransferase-like protein